jgi:hypothetical protein
MLRLGGVAAIAALVSCASPNVPVPSTIATAAQTAPLLPPAANLSGGWATGAVNEPPAGPVQTHPSCAYNPPVWLIEQNGNLLKTWAFPESFNQGIVRAGSEPARLTPTQGTISGDEVVIDGSDVRIVARYDTTTGHLRGIRNGQPFWAARQLIIRTEACPGIP